MHISSFEVKNYKSFLSTGPLEFKPGFNVIVGQNNVGKPALAEAASLHFRAEPHRSRTTISREGSSPDDHTSRAEIKVDFTSEELRNAIKDRRVPSPMYIPVDSNDPFARMRSGEQVARMLASRPSISAHLASETPDAYGVVVTTASLVGHEPAREAGYIQFHANYENGTLRYDPDVFGNASDRSRYLANILANHLRERVYFFNAVRFPSDEYEIGTSEELFSDASNLVRVLDLLSRNRTRWAEFFEKVKLVLPQIEAVTFIPKPNRTGSVQARVWNLPESTQRIDLTVPMSKSGTGVAQVLAIL